MTALLPTAGPAPMPPPRSGARARVAMLVASFAAAAVEVGIMDAGIGGEPGAATVIEVNSNPSIRLLEQSGRGDLILKIWHHTFSAMGLL